MNAGESDMKICVYAIAKNEEKHVERWVTSMREADYIVVLDTGSTDGTVEALRKAGVTRVESMKVEPWDFSVARNASMELCPEDADILVCTDIDEVFTKGWAAKVKAAFEAVPDATCAACRFITKFNADGTPCDTMHYWKIHRRSANARWVRRVHEYLEFGNKNEVYIEDMALEHHPDPTKSRAQYLDMLKAEAEEKHDPRSLFYYGRELMFKQRYLEAIFNFERAISHPENTWKDERAWAMRFIARCYGWLGDYDRSTAWFFRAIVESDWQREAALDLADLASTRGDWEMCIFVCNLALLRTDRHVNYFTEDASWGARPYDLLSVALYRVGRVKEALDNAKTASLYAPNDERIIKNIASMEKVLAEGEKKE